VKEMSKHSNKEVETVRKLNDAFQQELVDTVLNSNRAKDMNARVLALFDAYWLRGIGGLTSIKFMRFRESIQKIDWQTMRLLIKQTGKESVMNNMLNSLNITFLAYTRTLGAIRNSTMVFKWSLRDFKMDHDGEVIR